MVPKFSLACYFFCCYGDEVKTFNEKQLLHQIITLGIDKWRLFIVHQLLIVIIRQSCLPIEGLKGVSRIFWRFLWRFYGYFVNISESVFGEIF